MENEYQNQLKKQRQNKSLSRREQDKVRRNVSVSLTEKWMIFLLGPFSIFYLHNSSIFKQEDRNSLIKQGWSYLILSILFWSVVLLIVKLFLFHS